MLTLKVYFPSHTYQTNGMEIKWASQMFRSCTGHVILIIHEQDLGVNVLPRWQNVFNPQGIVTCSHSTLCLAYILKAFCRILNILKNV